MTLRYFLPHLAVALALGPTCLAGCGPATSQGMATASFEPARVAAGARLAALGNCIDCHTAAGGAPYAGGRPLKTPFGTIYGTNITPDPDTGLGRWSEADFARAMREGVDRDGRHLYPAFPYDYFTRLTAEDIKALYAFVMTREPVHAVTPPNPLPFPFNVRALIGVWKRLYFEPGEFRPDPAQSAEYNRGAYLVQGLAHCGACHTPRNRLGGQKTGGFLAGGEAEGWHAPALNAESPAPEPWTSEALYRYLRHGFSERHDVPAGPMAPVVHNLSSVPEQDVRAIAAYVAAQMGPVTPERRARRETAATPTAADTVSPAFLAGESVYAGACASCHDSGRLTPSSGDALHLQLSTSLNVPDPRNFIHIVLHGIAPRDGESGPWMPGYAGALTDGQITALAVYARSKFGGGAPWRDVENDVRKIRREKDQASMKKR